MPNGTHAVRVGKKTGLALTEYTANPSPESESVEEKARYNIPEAFILPNGFPDVGPMFISRMGYV